VLVDVNETQLSATGAAIAARGAAVRTYTLDITDLPGIRALRERLLAEGGPLDVLVNNAGLVFGGPFLEVPLEKHVLTYRVNVEGSWRSPMPSCPI